MSDGARARGPAVVAASCLVGLAGVLGFIDCRAQEDAFWSAIFPCTVDSDCGTTKANRPIFFMALPV